MMEQKRVPYHPVPNANNGPTLQRTLKTDLNIAIGAKVARHLLNDMEQTGVLEELRQFALLPDLFEDLKHQDPEVCSYLVL